MFQGQPPGDRPSFRRRIAHSDLQALYDLWLALRGDRLLLPRAEFDPLAAPRLLKSLILADVGDGGRAIRYRVVGTEIVAAHGYDYTGWTVERLTRGPTLDYTRALYGMVVAGATPVYSEGRFRWAGQEFRWTNRLHLPLSRGGNAVDMVLAGQVFVPESRRDRELLMAARPDELAADRMPA